MRVTHEDDRVIVRQSGSVMGPKHNEELRYNNSVVVVIEPAPQGHMPTARLVCPSWVGKSCLKGGRSSSGSVERNDALWAELMTSQSRSGAHWGGTILALVDDDHPIVVRQDHVAHRFGFGEPSPEEDSFCTPEGTVGLVVKVPYIPELHGRLRAGEFAENIGSWRPVGSHATNDAALLIRPKGVEGSEARFTCPEAIHSMEGAQVLLESAEAGGALTNRGGATVVSKLDGKPAKLVGSAGQRGELCCGTHGWFQAEGAIVIASANRYRGDVTVTLTRHAATVEGGQITMSQENIWSGAVTDEAPEVPDPYKAVAAAARAKSLDYHCRSLTGWGT